MAQVFVGDTSKIDPKFLAAVEGLPDEYYVFLEFTIERNIDCFLVRPAADGKSVAILVEIKRTCSPLSGDFNSPWKRRTNTGEWEPLPAKDKDANPYWQAVNAAGALKDWLWNHQARYRGGDGILPQEAFRVWPDLLILSPEGVRHELPLRPPSRYGMIYYSVDEWLGHVLHWQPRAKVLPVTGDELEALALALGLVRLGPSLEERVPQGSLQAARIPEPSLDVAEIAAHLMSLRQQMAVLEGRVRTLEGQRPPGVPVQPENFALPHRAG